MDLYSATRASITNGSACWDSHHTTTHRLAIELPSLAGETNACVGVTKGGHLFQAILVREKEQHGGTLSSHARQKWQYSRRPRM